MILIHETRNQTISKMGRWKRDSLGWWAFTGTQTLITDKSWRWKSFLLDTEYDSKFPTVANGYQNGKAGIEAGNE